MTADISSARPSPRRLVPLVLGALALAVLILGNSAPPAPAALHRDVKRPPRPEPRSLRAAATAPELPGRRSPDIRRAPNHPPRLIAAALDRSRLCRGESTFLRMSAEDPDDTDLRYQAMYFSPSLGTSTFGFGRWLRYQAPDQPGRYEVLAFVEDAARGRDSLALPVEVEDCAGAPGFDVGKLRILHTELDAQTHELDLRQAFAQARSSGHHLEVTAWHFGDGTTAAGAPSARHHYPIVMDRRYSYYLVRADVSLDGAPGHVEHGLSFYSYAAANLQAGYVALAADVERGDDTAGSIEYVVTFSNLTPYAALAREFAVVCLDQAGLVRERWREPLALNVPAETSLEQTLELDRRRCPGGATYELFGEADAGYSVGGTWSYKLRPTATVSDVNAAREQARRVLAEGERAALQ